MSNPISTTNANFGYMAKQYWDRGYRVLPVEPNAKRPAKEIAGWSGYAAGTLSDEKKSEMLRKYPLHGIGLLTGTEQSDGYRVGALDVDQDRFVEVTKTVVGNTVCAKRGKKGLTIIGRYIDQLKSSKLSDANGAGAVDLLFGGKFTVFPGSRHPETGSPYVWIGRALLDIEWNSLPVIDHQTIQLLRLVISSPHVDALCVGEGTHDAGLSLAAQLVSFGCDDSIITAIVAALLPQNYKGNSLLELPGWIKSARDKGFDKNSDKPKKGKAKSCASDDLVESLSASGIGLFHDNRKRGFIDIPTEAGGVLTYPLSSSAAAAVLQQAYYKLTKRPLKEAARSEVTALLEARARFDGSRKEVFTRIGRHGSDVVIDLGTDDGSVVIINAESYSVVRRSPISFVRTPGMLELPEPVPGGTLSDLQALLRLPDQDFALVLAFLLNVLRPGGPFLCLLVEGEQGSGKSFLSSVLRRLTDPNQAEKVRLPENERDLMVMADALFMLVFDNCSGMSANVSDALCSLSTGGGYISRKLYTDGELYTMSSIRPFIINGISDVATKSDLIERVIPMTLSRMDDDARRTESEMDAELEKCRPRILGALYEAVACAIRNEAGTETPVGVRMADAARWLIAAEPATGLKPGTFLRTLTECQNERIITRTSNDAAVSALMTLLENGPFQGTVGELLELIPAERYSKYYPDTPQKLSKHLERHRTGLKMLDIHIDRLPRTNKGQVIRIWRDGQESSPPAPKVKFDFGPKPAPGAPGY